MQTPDPGPDLLPPATLTLARTLRDDLAQLLAQERTAAAAFLAALADFDARLGWEPLGHASLFGFLHRDLGLSKGAAYLRFTAVRLMRRFPEVAEALRTGQLCLSAVGELSRVMTLENRAEVLPLFYGCSSREARLVAAALVPRASQPRREVVTRLPLVSRPRPLHDGEAEAPVEAEAAAPPAGGVEPPLEGDGVGWDEPDEAGSPHREAMRAGDGPVRCASRVDAPSLPVAGPEGASLDAARPSAGARATAPAARAEVRAHELAAVRPAWVPPGPECVPLDADLRRLHLTVSRGLLAKLEAARAGLSHLLPGATTEQVLEAALDLLLERQARTRKTLPARRRSQRPPRVAGVRQVALPPAAEVAFQAASVATAAGEASPVEAAPAPERGPALGPPPRPLVAARVQAQPETAASGRPDGGLGRRESRSARTIPAAVEREVRERDGGRCQFRLDSGGICGSTTRVQLDHVVPVALGGQAIVENLRLLCAPHNRYAARLALGEGVMVTARRQKARRARGGEPAGSGEVSRAGRGGDGDKVG